MDELVNGESDIEEPEETSDLQSTPPPMVFSYKNEEHETLNQGRWMVDESMDPTKVPKGPATKNMKKGYKNYNDTYECENVMPWVEDCMTKGKDISTWFTERILNPSMMCDFAKEIGRAHV